MGRRDRFVSLTSAPPPAGVKRAGLNFLKEEVRWVQSEYLYKPRLVIMFLPLDTRGGRGRLPPIRFDEEGTSKNADLVTRTLNVHRAPDRVAKFSGCSLNHSKAKGFDVRTQWQARIE